jgi:hypothetical protein
MKNPSSGSTADSLIEYLHTHTPILTDQGINVAGFIARLSALRNDSTPPPPLSQALPKSKSRKKQPN